MAFRRANLLLMTSFISLSKSSISKICHFHYPHNNILYNTVIFGHLQLQNRHISQQNPMKGKQSLSKPIKSIKPVRVHNLKGKRGANVKVKGHQGQNQDDGEFFDFSKSMDSLEEVEEKADNIEANVNRLGSMHARFEAEEEQMQYLKAVSARIRFKTIERKYFRKPKTPNLLTWDAKEQMRYLHKGEEWSVSDLADHYPVPLESIEKILKSRVRLHRTEDMQRHDRDVRANWQNIKAEWEQHREPISEAVIEGMKNSEGEFVIANAAGIGNKFIPRPVEPPKVRGPFTLIVKDCLNEKSKEHKEESKAHSEGRNAFRKELENVSAVFREAGKELQDSQQSELVNSNIDRDYSGRFAKGISIVKRQDLRKKPSQGSTVSFQDGDCVYSEDGDFLYRIP